MLFIASTFALVPTDTHRHPISGVIIDSRPAGDGLNYVWTVQTDFGTQMVTEVPEIVNEKYPVGSNVTVMIRGTQYRYMGDIM